VRSTVPRQRSASATTISWRRRRGSQRGEAVVPLRADVGHPADRAGQWGGRGLKARLATLALGLDEPRALQLGQVLGDGLAADRQARRELSRGRRLDLGPGQPAEQIHAGSDRDRFMTPVEAVEYGLVDRIATAKR